MNIPQASVGGGAMKNIKHITILFFSASLIVGIFLIASGKYGQVLATSPFSPKVSMLVTTLDDELNNDGDCSLREAISAANNNISVDACPAGDDVYTDTITFNGSGTIILTSELLISPGGPLDIDGANVITVSGGGTTRVWRVDADSVVLFRDIRIINGFSIYNGAGLYNNDGEVIILNSTISENHSENSGGGIANSGSITISSSTFYNNGANYGGGIYNTGLVGIINSTFSGNFAYIGGGLDNTLHASITNSTFSGNGGSVSGGGIQSTIPMDIANTIVANSLIGGDCSGSITDIGHNIDTDGHAV